MKDDLQEGEIHRGIDLTFNFFKTESALKRSNFCDINHFFSHGQAAI